MYYIIKEDYRYILFFIGDKISMIEYPNRFVSKGIWNADGYECISTTIIPPFSTLMYVLKNHLLSPELGKVHECIISSASNILPEEYKLVKSGQDLMCKWYFTLPLAAPQPLAAAQPLALPLPLPVAQPYIPNFVYYRYIESAIKNKEECPITLLPLTRNEVGGLTCGHLFNLDALRIALNNKSTCPTCCQPAYQADILSA